MKIFRFDHDLARRIEQHGSSFLQSWLSITDGGFVQVTMMYFTAGDHVGRHRATVPQLFAVVQGEGWVEDERRARRPITTGRAAFWIGGEWHAAGTDGAMTASVIEGPRVDPSRFMREVDAGEAPATV